MTTSGLSLNTLAVAFMAMVTGLEPQLEADDAAVSDSVHDLLRGAAGGCPIADDVVRVRGVDRSRLDGTGAWPSGLPAAPAGAAAASSQHKAMTGTGNRRVLRMVVRRT